MFLLPFKRRKKYVLGRKPSHHHTASIIISVVVLVVLLVISHTLWAANAGEPKEAAKQPKHPGQTSSASIMLPFPAATQPGKGKPAGTGGSSSPPAAISNPGKVYGIALGSSYAGFSEGELNARFGDMKSMGVTWVRFDIEWPNVQPSNENQGNWNDYDKLVKAARNHNLQVLAIIDYTPGWARVDGCNSSQCAPKDPAQFAAFAAKVVKRYAPQGVHAWEVWNEPNNRQFWQPAADAGAYTRLLKATYPAIKAADPQAFVLAAGLAPMPTDDENISRRDFLQRMYNEGAKGYFDAMSDHPYTFPRLPADGTDRAWSEMSTTSPSMRSIMVANGDGGKKIWLTEFGAPTGGPGDTATPENGESIGGVWQVNDQLQANILREASRLYESYDWAGPLFWYSYKDAGDSSDTNENFFGLIRYDGSRKPAYDVFKEISR